MHASLLERLTSRRDGLLASARFQRLALRFAPTRAAARRHGQELFDLLAGFVYSQVLLACMQLGVLEQLRDGPKSLKALAHRSRVPVTAMRTLLRAAAALGLVRWRRGGQRLGLGARGAILLGNPPLRAMIEHHRLFYDDLRDPVRLLRRRPGNSRLAQYWAYAGQAQSGELPDERTRAYTGLMSATQGLIGEEILAAYPLRRHRCLLDVGGGDGTFAALAAARCPQLRVVCFDLPAVARRARERFAAARLGARAEVVAGDFLNERLPGGADLICLVRVLHDHEDPQVLRILLAARAALPAGGRLLVAEPLSGTAGAERVADVYFGMYLWAMGSGRPRSAAHLARLLIAAGFQRPRLHPTRMPMNVRVLVARCAAGSSH